MEATLWRIKNFAGWIAGVVGTILAWIAGFELLTKFVQAQNTISWIATTYVFGSLLPATAFVAYRQYLLGRKERYANVSPILHQLFHEIRDLQTYLDLHEPKKGSKEEYKRFINHSKMGFGRVLDHLNSVFTSITSTHCRTSIKLTYVHPGGKIYVYTLAKDRGSRQKCIQIDNKRVENNHDPLDANREFARLFSSSEERWHFICNDLTRESNFESTSVTAYKPEYATRVTHRAETWPLPYRSTITCVIRQGPFDLDLDQRSEVLGFLAVDSESRGVFEERWDVQIMFAVADALYHPVRAYLDAQNRVTHLASSTKTGTGVGE